MQEITKHWINSSESDLMIIRKIKDDLYLTHQIAFHAQQAIEKLFKAVLEENGLKVPKTHSLQLLMDKIKHIISIDVDLDIFILLDDLYIDARYPGDLGLLPNGKPSLYEANIFYNTAIDVRNAILNTFEQKDLSNK